MFTHFDQIFVPIFVAMSTLSALPIFLSMTEGLTPEQSRRTANSAVLTALVVAMLITVAGQAIFRLLGITVNDLRVAGGVILLVLSIHDLLFSRLDRKEKELRADAGVVPLGVPLIVGPATMTTCLVLADVYGRGEVLVSLLLNLAITSVLLRNAHQVKRVVNPSVSQAFGKVMAVFMAAIAVSMMRVGVAAFLAEGIR